jgi:acetylornithine deacetylase/succinyl-diaminopimelate desuccinylase-like protein
MAAVFTAEPDDGIDHGSVADIHRRGSACRGSMRRGSRSGWWAAGCGVLLLLAAGALAADDAVTPAADAPDPQSGAARGRLRESVEWLASPDREGRFTGSKGGDAAADYIAARLAEMGLDTKLVGDGPFQSFVVTLGSKLGPAERNRAELVGPPRPDGDPDIVPLVLGKDFTPMAGGGTGPFDLPLAFAGYGITAPPEKYDDYAPFASREGGARGLAVIVLRQEPQKDDPRSVFDGNKPSQHAPLARKAANAAKHEVGGIVFCNDADKDGDKLMELNRVGQAGGRRGQPILHVRRSLLDDVVRRCGGRGLEEIQKGVDESLTPASVVLDGWRIRGETAIEREEGKTRNVLAMLRGSGAEAAADRPAIRAEETVVLGAHYDHIGYGGSNSAAPDVRAVHHGADDNASGTALMLEVARRLAAAGPLPRSVVFVAFSGEEIGLLGSEHYTANPSVPLADTVAMVNLDMVGRMQDDKLIIQGMDTATVFGPLVDRLGAAGRLTIRKQPGGSGPSDHASFYAKKIPVLHLFTGTHPDYHRPTDTAEKINYEGMERLATMVTELVTELARVPERPAYLQGGSKKTRGGDGRPFFGSIPDFKSEAKGFAISGVAKNSPAEKGGLRAGDLIVQLGESMITGLDDFDSAIRSHKPGDTVPVVVVRAGVEVRLEVVLGEPR